jgi:glutaredoxin
MHNSDSLVDEIVKNSHDTFVILYVPTCHYSMGAIDLLNKSGYPYYGYDINTIGGMELVLKSLNDNRNILDFDPQHRTKPIIFYNGKFIGGYTELKKMIPM